jgi:ABC-2 type transport system permease protein
MPSVALFYLRINNKEVYIAMKMMRHTRLLFMRNVRLTLRNPAWAVIGLFQPLCYMLLFAPLLQPLSNVPGFPPGGALMVFTPGVLIMMAIFGTAFTGFGLIYDLQAGVIERLRATPVSRWALLLGLVLRDVVVLLIQSLLLVLIALPLGVHINLPGLLLMLGLMVLVALCLASCSYALALMLRDASALASFLNTLSLPALLLSGITLPLTLAPPIIQHIALVDPFAYVVNAARLLFRGVIANGTILVGYIIMGVLALLAMIWGVRAFMRAAAA